MVRNLPALWETQVRSLGQEDPLEKKMAAHSSILAWRIPWTESLAATVREVTESYTTEQLTHTVISLTCKGRTANLNCMFLGHI